VHLSISKLQLVWIPLTCVFPFEFAASDFSMHSMRTDRHQPADVGKQLAPQKNKKAGEFRTNRKLILRS